MALLAQIMLPNDKERQQIFYWLKQVSSWSAWNRILGYYREWLKVSESSVREASIRNWDHRTGVPESDYRLILKGFAHCDEGVRRLRMGDKRVFKYDANGELVMAYRIPSYWHQKLWHIEDGETGIDEEHTPRWESFKRKLIDLCEAWGECSPVVLEPEDLNAPSRLPYGVWLQENLSKMHFPSELPDVPDPIDNVLVATGKLIPCSGIWEPVDAPKSKGLSLFRAGPPPRGFLPFVGCMNYLHEGSAAPQASLETKNDNPNINATWRLLWRDDRYINGTIPLEESSYVFLMPEAQEADPVTSYASTATNMIVAETGQSAPIGGRWLAQHDLHAAVYVTQGELMPEHKGQSIRWVLAEPKTPPN